MKFRYMEKLPASLCLALFLISGFAHADDNSLIREANAALSQKDYGAAFSKFSVLAQHGNATAQFNLGVFYLNGQGVQKDEKQAFEWLGKSAAQGHARALQVLQSAAAKGNEGAKTELNKLQPQTASQPTQPLGASPQAPTGSQDDKALFAEANTALAQKDYNTAFPKFLVLAQQGNAIAQFNVGAFYLNGLGVQKDQKQAYDWFAKSAAQGNARAVNVMQSAEAKAKADAQAKAEAQTKADAQARADAKAKSESKANAKVDADPNGIGAAPRARSGRTRESESLSSSFSLGVSLGQTGKMTGIKNSSSLGLLAGYKINSNFGVELAYHSLYRNANADSFLASSYPGTTGTFDLTSVSAAGQYTYDLGSNLYLLGNFGLHTSSFKVKSSGAGSSTGSSTGVIVGVKVQYNLNKSMGIRGGFDTYTESGGMTGSLTEVGMAVITRF